MKVVAATLLALAGLAFTSEGAFTDRVSDASTLALYTFEQNECRTNEFLPWVPNGLGVLKYDNTAYTPDSFNGRNKCPIVQSNGHVYYSAHNGVQFSGERAEFDSNDEFLPGSITKYEFVESENTIAALDLSGNQMTFEMWIKYTTGSGNKKLVLFEIGQPELPASNSDWVCDQNKNDFAAQLIYNPGSARFEFTYRHGTDCSLALFTIPSPLSTAVGSLYHVVLQTGQVVTPTVMIWNLYVSNVASPPSSFTPLTGSGQPVDTSKWNSTHTLKIGSSPFVVSSLNAAPTGGLYSWGGSVLLFALYNRELNAAEIEQNFNAQLPNSAPSVPGETGGMTFLNALEDSNVELDVTDLLAYDFDNVYFGASQSITYSVKSNLTDASNVAGDVGGNLRLTETGEVKMGVFDFGTLFFEPTITHAYGGPAQFQVSARDDSNDNFESHLEGTVSIYVAAANDLPEPNPPNPSVDVPQTRSVEVVLSAMDVDCSIAQDFAQQSNLEPAQQSSCELFGLDKFRIETAPTYGKLYEPDVDGKCIAFQVASEVTFPYEFTISYPAPLDNTALGTKSKKLCYEGCLTDSPTNPCPVNTTQSADGIVAVENVTYVVYDKANAEVAQDITVTVTSVLTTGLEEKVHYIIDEDVDFYKFELQGVDNFCNTPDGELLPEAELPAICADRQKRFALKELPPAYQGELYLAPNNESVVTPEMLAAEGQKGLLLDVDANNQTFIYFKPTANYFNQDRWPLCNSGTGGFTRCPSSDRKAADVNDFKCTGPELADNPRTCLQLASGATPSTDLVFYTVQDLEGAIMGQCGATRPSALVPGNDKYLSEGCPVNIVYSLDVNGLQSQAKTGNKIWVTNVHDAAELVMPLELIEDVQEGKKIPLKNKDGECVRIDTLGEGDVRVLELKVEVALTRGQIQVDPELAELTVDKVEYIIGGGSRATGASDFRLVGTAKQLNEDLCAMSYIADRTFEFADIKFELFDVSDTRKKPTFGEGNKVESISRVGLIKLKFKQETITDKALNVTAIVTWSSISAAVLLILGACYCCLHSIFRRALAGERAAVWFVRNILFTHIDPHDEHALDHEKGVDEAARSFEEAIHAEKVNMERVRCCARLLATICPCCCKFDPNAGHDLPSEEEMQVAALRKINEKIASKHVPSLEERNKSLRLEVAEDEIFDWEVHQHVDEKTGKVTNYYYNSRTGASSWTKPSVKVRRPIDENI